MAEGLSDYEPTLLAACSNGSQGIVNLWLSETKYDLNRPGSSKDGNDNVLLTVAATHANLDMMALLFEHGADPNIKNPEGKMALYIAAESGFEEVVTMLLARPGIDPGVEGPCGTALQVATATVNLGYARQLESRSSRGAVKAPEPAWSRRGEKPVVPVRGGREAQVISVQIE